MLDRILKYPLLTISLMLALSLFVASASAWIKPSATMIPVYFGLAFPAIALLNILMGLYWIMKRKWYLVIPVGSLLLCGHNLQKTLAIHSSQATATTTGQKLKVLTYNIKLFNYYEKKTDVLDYLLKEDADIVCLQEFGYHTGKEKKFMTRDIITAAMNKKYPYHHFSQSDNKTNGTNGMATFSKYPLVKYDDIRIESRYKSATYSDFKVGNDTIRVVNLHLESNKLTSNDKKPLQEWQKFTLSDSSKTKVAKNLDKKLSDAYQLREVQAETIAKFIAQTKHPIVLCADMNDVPVSFTYNKLTGDKLTDAYTEKGAGYGHTFNEGVIKFRIDYVLHSNHFSTLSYKRDTVTYSDHYPVVVELAKTHK